MRISLKKILVIAGFGLVVGCTPSGDGGDAGVECTSNLDCEGTDQCQLELGVCETPCTSDAECTEDGRTVCNMLPDPDGDYPLDVDGTRDHCICQEGTCPAGETCSATGLCEPGEGENDAGPQDECTVATEVADCGADAFCIDGACEDACIDDQCIPEGDLCQFDDTAVEFNQCVLADDLTSDCTPAGNAPTQAGAQDIVIYGSETIAVDEAGCDVAGSTYLRSYVFDVYSEEDLSGATAQDVVFRPGFTAGNEKFFQDVGAGATTDITAINGFPNEFLVTTYICGGPSAPDSAAIQIDTDSNTSNAFCFDPLAAP